MSYKLLLSQDFNSVEQTPEPLIESNYFNFNRENVTRRQPLGAATKSRRGDARLDIGDRTFVRIT